MAHSCTRIYVHLVFATKNRQPLITEEIRVELEKYSSAIYKAENHILVAQYCMPDHYHSLFRLHPAESLANLIQKMKGSTARWLNEKFYQGEFEWQIGYGAFSHLSGDLEGILRYIRKQPEHHRNKGLEIEIQQLNLKYQTDWSLD